MAFIHCVQGGSTIERIEGEFEGTNAGQFIVESKRGKTPKRAFIYNTVKAAAGTSHSRVFWEADSDAAGYYVRSYDNQAPVRTNTNASTAYYCALTIADHSITIICPTNATYYTGTFKYIVEFE